MSGNRYNTSKPKLSFVLEAYEALSGASKVLEFGANKYSRSNWRGGLDHTEVVDSLCRHVSKYMSGEDVDEESGLPHVDHVLCNALFLAEMVRTNPELDSRGIIFEDIDNS